jgi:hypothetical protein
METMMSSRAEQLSVRTARRATIVARPACAAIVLLFTQSCGEHGPATPTPGGPAIAVISDTSRIALSGDRSALTSGPAGRVFVSMPPSSYPGGVKATIRNRRTAETATKSMFDGGFDPIALFAEAGDTLETRISFASGAGDVVESSTVPKRKRPTVVRTVPLRNKTDVPLNQQLVVVFSEPVQRASLTSALRLSTGGNIVQGSIQLSADQLIATYEPASGLLPATSYEFIVTVDVMDLDGDRLQEQHAVTFTTEPLRTAPVRIRTATSGVAPDENGYEITLAGMSLWTVPQSPNAWAYFAAVPYGDHVALIGHVAPNCTASPATLPISVPAQSEATFAITCEASDGVRITTTTTGVDPDSDGYVLDLVRPGVHEKLALPSNGTASRYGLLFGDFTLTLRAVAANCRVLGANPRTVAVPDDGVADVTFDVSCETPGVLAYARPTDFAGGVTIGPSDIHVVDARGAQPGQLTTVPAHDADPAWSLDGARIAFTSNRDGNDEIYAMNGDGSSPARLTTNPARDYYAAWSPDGSRIAFVSERDGNAEIYVMKADGTALTRLTTHAAADDSPAWSPDGARIAFRSDRDGNQEIYVMNADGSAIQRLTVDGADDRDPAWSPDGTKIAFSRLGGCGDVDGAGTILCGSNLLIMLANGTNLTSVVAGIPDDTTQIIHGAGDVRQPAWSLDGRKIAAAVSYCGGDGDCHVMMAIWIIDLVVPDPVQVIGFESYATGGSAYSFRPSWRNGTP